MNVDSHFVEKVKVQYKFKLIKKTNKQNIQSCWKIN